MVHLGIGTKLPTCLNFFLRGDEYVVTFSRPALKPQSTSHPTPPHPWCPCLSHVSSEVEPPEDLAQAAGGLRCPGRRGLCRARRPPGALRMGSRNGAQALAGGGVGKKVEKGAGGFKESFRGRSRFVEQVWFGREGR